MTTTMKRLALCASAALVSACGSEGPEAVTEAFWQAGRDGDFETARSHVSESSRASISEDASSSIEAFSIGEATVDGSEATVETRLVMEMGSGTREVEFETAVIEEDGTWKIDLDATTSHMMGQLLGVTMEEFGEQLGEAMGEAMKGAMEGMAEGMRELGQAMGDAAEEMETASSGNR